jgi:hypothetical protein
MKTRCGLMLVATALVLGGCGKEQNSPPPAATPTPAPAGATGGYLGTLARGQRSAVKTIDVTALNEEVRLFNVQEGRNPKDLNELVTKQYLHVLPTPPNGFKLVYDAVEGKVSVAAE